MVSGGGAANVGIPVGTCERDVIEYFTIICIMTKHLRENMYMFTSNKNVTITCEGYNVL